MQTLNLPYPDNSNVHFKRVKYPDGQQDVLIDITTLNTKQPVLIKSRFNSFKDLEVIMCTVHSLRRCKVKEIHLYIPYLLGARSDRQFQDGGNSYLVDVIAPIINSLGFESVEMIDVHSDVSMGVIHNSKCKSNSFLVKWGIKDIIKEEVTVVSPDGGALKKIYDTVMGASLDCEIIISAKHRDIKTGKLNKFDVPIKPHQKHSTLVWIDDICDGGGTFIGEAIEANLNGHVGKKHIIVTHGVFSQGIEKLHEYFDKIICTNSVSDDSDGLTKCDVFL